jgi:hypothetical protein
MNAKLAACVASGGIVGLIAYIVLFREKKTEVKTQQKTEPQPEPQPEPQTETVTQ